MEVETLVRKKILEKTLRIGLVGESKAKADYITRPTEYKGIIQYLYSDVSSDEGMKIMHVTDEVLSISGMTVDEAFDIALFNTSQDSVLMHSSQVPIFFGNGEGSEQEISEIMKESPIPLYIITNRSANRGASAILNKALIKRFAKDIGAEKLLAIPSTIHEFILVPITDEGAENIDFFKSIVQDVNTNVVCPDEVLSNEAYIITA